MKNDILSNCIVASICCIGILTMLFSFFYCARPIDPYCLYSDDGRGIDFVLRLSEVDCLRTGVNPYRVWNGEVSHPLYCSAFEYGNGQHPGKLPVNAYTPWEYSFIFPLTLVRSWDVRWAIYTVVRFLAFAFIIGYFFRMAFGIRGRVMDVCFCGACLSLTAGAVFSDLMPSNFAIFLTFFALAMVICLNTGHFCIAGVFWSLMMVKPQIGLLFALPLMMARRFDTIIVAVFICLVLSIPPFLMCGESMLSMMTQAPAASVHAFGGCALMPLFLFEWLHDSAGCPAYMILGVAALFGVVLCAVASWYVRSEEDWLVRVFPCVVISLGWTYIQSYSHVFSMLSIFLVSCVCIKARSWFVRVLCMLSVVALSDVSFHFIRAIARLCNMCGPETPDRLSNFMRWSGGFSSIMLCMLLCVKRMFGHGFQGRSAARRICL